MWRVSGLEGGVAIESIGIVFIGIGWVGLQPEWLGAPLVVHHIDNVVLVAGGDVVRLAEESSIRLRGSTASL